MIGKFGISVSLMIGQQSAVSRQFLIEERLLVGHIVCQRNRDREQSGVFAMIWRFVRRGNDLMVQCSCEKIRG
jgi:hypothetical protein